MSGAMVITLTERRGMWRARWMGPDEVPGEYRSPDRQRAALMLYAHTLVWLGRGPAPVLEVQS